MELVEPKVETIDNHFFPHLGKNHKERGKKIENEQM